VRRVWTNATGLSRATDVPHAGHIGKLLLSVVQAQADRNALREPRLEAVALAAHQRAREGFEQCGVRIGVHRLGRLRKKLGLRCEQKRRFKATMNLKHDLPVARNLLNQDFSATAPSQV